MKVTLIQPTDVPGQLRDRFGAYHLMFERLFAHAGFTFETIKLSDGQPLPDPSTLDATLVMGSAAGVYDKHYPWMDPLRDFIRGAYAARTPMVGICFGHQIIADALGGDVRKSEKGWGLGRHVYNLRSRPAPIASALPEFAIACSHQDQVIAPPAEAETFLASEFTPHAGLMYRNGAALTLQPHPEFEDDYTLALAELRRGLAPDHVVDTALNSVSRRSDSREVGGYLAAFLRRA
ncbi:MAG TPA: type 1 glutamine amidotransferase [Devosia sp.]|jgi:GMP synthase-like glutamine amidotransferase|nr:type 1 glutamine amidotransferase [Devosia sp.]